LCKDERGHSEATLMMMPMTTDEWSAGKGQVSDSLGVLFLTDGPSVHRVTRLSRSDKESVVQVEKWHP
jgi:hypothetical protein